MKYYATFIKSLMADLDLWTENSTLSNFADDTQSIIVRDDKKNLLETASSEAHCVIDFLEVMV